MEELTSKRRFHGNRATLFRRPALKKAISALVIVMLMAATVRAADLEERWIYVSMNLMYDTDTDSMVKLIGEARKAGVTHVHFSDYQSAMMYDMGPHYFANIEKVRKAANDAGIIIAPAIFPLGMSGRYLFHNPNMADSIPVRNMRFVVNNREAVADPSLKPEIANGGFDAAENGTPTAWRVDVGPAQSMSRSEADEGDAVALEAARKDADISVAVDSAVRHSGAGSRKRRGGFARAQANSSRSSLSTRIA
jgi:hypothetical protein